MKQVAINEQLYGKNAYVIKPYTQSELTEASKRYCDYLDKLRKDSKGLEDIDTIGNYRSQINTVLLDSFPHNAFVLRSSMCRVEVILHPDYQNK